MKKIYFIVFGSEIHVIRFEVSNNERVFLDVISMKFRCLQISLSSGQLWKRSDKYRFLAKSILFLTTE